MLHTCCTSMCIFVLFVGEIGLKPFFQTGHVSGVIVNLTRYWFNHPCSSVLIVTGMLLWIVPFERWKFIHSSQRGASPLIQGFCWHHQGLRTPNQIHKSLTSNFLLVKMVSLLLLFFSFTWEHRTLKKNGISDLTSNLKKIYHSKRYPSLLIYVYTHSQFGYGWWCQGTPTTKTAS